MSLNNNRLISKNNILVEDIEQIKMANTQIKIENGLKINNNNILIMNTTTTVTYDIQEVIKTLAIKGIYEPQYNKNFTQCSTVKQIIQQDGDFIQDSLNINICIITSDIPNKKGSKFFYIVTSKWLNKCIIENQLNRNLYECILDNPVKLFFDIEYNSNLGKDKYLEFIVEVKKIFLEDFEEELEDPIVFTNCDDNDEQILKVNNDRLEYSYHIHFYSQKRFKNLSQHLKRWVCNDLESKLSPIFKSNEKSDNGLPIVPKLDRFYDQSVYSKTRSMRMLFQSKIGKSNQRLTLINPEQLENLQEDPELQSTYGTNYIELVLVQELNYTGDFYKVDIDIVSDEQKLLLGDEDVLEEIINKPDEKADKIIINSFKDILMAIPADQPTAFKIMVASFCKKNGLKKLYKKWCGSDKYWDDISLHSNRQCKKEMNKIINKYKPLFSRNEKRTDTCILQPFSPQCDTCSWGVNHKSGQTHSLIITQNCIKEMCLGCCEGDKKILYKNAQNQTITTDFFKYVLSYYYEKIIDLTLIKEFYQMLDKKNDLVKNDFDYITNNNVWVGDLSKHIEPTWVLDGEKKVNKITDFFKRRKNIINPEEVNTLIVQADLGKGKSFSMEKFCKKFKSHYKRKLIITSRVSYSTSILDRYNSSGLKFKYYKDETDLSTCDNLVIQLESIYKILAKGEVLPFDLIILDECESIFSQFSSSTFLKSTTKIKNIDAFKSIVSNAKHVILMDAFITTRTIECIQLFRQGTIRFYNNKLRNGGLVFNEIKHTDKDLFEDTMARKMVEKLQAGKKIYGFISSKKSIKYIEKFIENAGFNVRVYHGDLSAKQKTILNPDEDWINYDCVLTTSTITIGIDFNVEYFDCSFYLGNDKSCCVRDCFQGLYRVRKLKTKQVYYLIKQTEKSFSSSFYQQQQDFTSTFERVVELLKQNKDAEELLDITSNNDNRKWIVNVLAWNCLEQRINSSFFKETFRFFCKVQGYTLNEIGEDQKGTVLEADNIPNALIRLLDDAEEINKILETPSEHRTLQEQLELMKLKIFQQTGISNCERTFSRFKTTKNGYYFDLLLNNNHSIKDIEKTIIPDISEKQRNNTTFNLITVKKLLQTINKDNKDIYTETITFKGKDITEFLKAEGKDLKKLKKCFRGSSFSITQSKQAQTKLESGKKITDILESEFQFNCLVKRNCKKNFAKYQEAITRQEQQNYSSDIDISTDICLEDYITEVVEGMKGYKQSQNKLNICLL